MRQSFYSQFLALREKIRALRDPRLRKFEERRRRYYHDLWTSSARAVGASAEDLGNGFQRIERSGAATYVSDTLVMLDSALALKIAGDKPLTHRILSRHGFPLVRFVEYDLSRMEKARRFIRDLRKQVVVKPAASGYAGRGVTTGVFSSASLRKASVRATAFRPRLLVEEQIEGDTIRLLYLDGKFLDAVRRRPPSVVGDGTHTIRGLVRMENSRRLGGEIVALHPLELDLDAKLFLAAAGRTLREVPEGGRPVVVKRIANQNSDRDNDSVRSLVHPSVVELGAKACRVLDLQLAAVDLITPDVSRPLPEVGGVVGEVNTTPALHHHYFLSNRDEVVPVATLILDFLLSAKRSWS